MLTNKEIANTFNLLAKYMELHQENSFRIRSYANAYIQLRKWGEPLSEMTDAEIGKIKGVGKSVVGKVRELLNTGELSKLKDYQTKTPIGIQDMLRIKGFGPKKIAIIWKELGAESLGELWYACNENRLIALKGFGEKTQLDLKKKIEYFLQSKDKFHYATLEKEAIGLIKTIQKILPAATISLAGAMRRRAIIVERIELIIGTSEEIDTLFDTKSKAKLTLTSSKLANTTEGIYYAQSANNFPVTIFTCPPEEFGSKLFKRTGTKAFLEAFVAQHKGIDFKGFSDEKSIFEKVNLPFIEAELREDATYLTQTPPQLVEIEDMKGVVHAHTTYSDGLHTLREMAEYAKEQGFEYLALTDHSKSAFYANGLKVDRVLAQMEEIDALNKELTPFKIFKGIESDIINDGSLDYEEDILKRFDFIIASVHSNLKMDKTKATARILKAVQNPYTTILGHPTGRLLLAREGYPLDFEVIIKACAEHNVAIEVNANPHRLDLDWQWVRYALDLGVKICINPDAHSKEGMHDIRFGTFAARKGGLTKLECLNTLGVQAFNDFLVNRKIELGINN